MKLSAEVPPTSIRTSTGAGGSIDATWRCQWLPEARSVNDVGKPASQQASKCDVMLRWPRWPHRLRSVACGGAS